jgi:hypothetical protein
MYEKKTKTKTMNHEPLTLNRYNSIIYKKAKTESVIIFYLQIVGYI